MPSCRDAPESTNKLAALWDEKERTFVCTVMLSGIKSIDNVPLEKKIAVEN